MHNYYDFRYLAIILTLMHSQNDGTIILFLQQLQLDFMLWSYLEQLGFINASTYYKWWNNGLLRINQLTFTAAIANKKKIGLIKLKNY